MFKENHLSFRQRKYMKIKNIIGRTLGGIGLVVLSPVYLAIIVAIKKEDGITAPVFFSQKRVGIHKEYFNLYKFRSMRTDTPHDKPTHLLENPDQYITKVGRFLRKSSLDELPQHAFQLVDTQRLLGYQHVAFVDGQLCLCKFRQHILRCARFLQLVRALRLHDVASRRANVSRRDVASRRPCRASAIKIHHGLIHITPASR